MSKRPRYQPDLRPGFTMTRMLEPLNKPDVPVLPTLLEMKSTINGLVGQDNLNSLLARLNKAFIKKCNSSVDRKKGGDPSASLVPIALDYVSNTLKIILNHEEIYPADKNVQNFFSDVDSSVTKLATGIRGQKRRKKSLEGVGKKAALVAPKEFNNNSIKRPPISVQPPTSSAGSSSLAPVVWNTIPPVHNTSSSPAINTVPPKSSTLTTAFAFKPGLPTSSFNTTSNSSTGFVGNSFLTKPASTGFAFPVPPTPSTNFNLSSASPTSTSLSTLGNSVPNPTKTTNGDEDDEEDAEPPKNEFKLPEEKNVVYQTRVKVFEKAEGNYKELGLGALYVKELTEPKYGHQLFVRAENNLGTILVNILLTESLPLTTLKNNVRTVDPTKKTIYLIRVKSVEEAEQLKSKLAEFAKKSN